MTRPLVLFLLLHAACHPARALSVLSAAGVSASSGGTFLWSALRNTTTGHVEVPHGQVWYLDESMEVETLTIKGTLRWDTSKDGLELRTAYLLVRDGGYFQLGTMHQPMENQATVYITKKPAETHSHMALGYRFLATFGDASRIDIHGRTLQRTWTLLGKTVRAGSSELFLKHDPTEMGWRVGDRIGLATTSKGNSTVHKIKAIGPATEYKLNIVGATSGHHFNTYTAENAIDGNLQTYWGSYCTHHWCDGTEQWIEVTLESPSDVTGLRVKFDNSRFAPKFTVQARANETDSQWHHLGSADNVRGNWVQVPAEACAGDCSFQVLRLTADRRAMKRRDTEPSWAGLKLRELEVFGKVSGAAVPMVLHLDTPVKNMHYGGIKEVQGHYFELAAEVVNLERSVVITGDHETFYETFQGIHTAMVGTGLMDIRYARVEYCGQRDNMGRYCMHFHQGGHCTDCTLQGNAIVDSQQGGVTIHGTHRSVIDSNVMWDVRAVGVYVEDGNEMYNMISRNVIVCSVPGLCSVSWQNKAASQAGIYLIGMTNDLIENRIAGYENGIWTAGSHIPTGQGHASMRVCPMHTPFGTIRGNVCHDNMRFGLYLDNQYPRNVARDSSGFVTDPGSCGEFRDDGRDNGVVPANTIEDEFDYHNMFVGQYAMGDVSYIRFTSLNNAHTIYWKDTKNFADGKSHHVRDSILANDPSDPYGLLQFYGPSGPFTFLFTNNTWVGSPVGSAALNAGQHCGRVGAGGPCNVQYLLKDVDWSRLPIEAKRIKYGVNSMDPGFVLPIFLAADDTSLGGHRSMVSKHLKGFKDLPGCQSVGRVWDNAIGCQDQIRRLNVWTTADVGIVNLTGPGYVSKEEATLDAPVHGMDAGMLPFENIDGTATKGYGAPVLMGANYTVSGAWSGDVAFDFSDPILEEYFGEPEAINLNVSGSQLCHLTAMEDRSFISAKTGIADASSASDLLVACKLVGSATESFESFVGDFGEATVVQASAGAFDTCNVGDEVACCPDGSCDEVCSGSTCCPGLGGGGSRNTTCPSARYDQVAGCALPKAFDCTPPVVGREEGECAWPNEPAMTYYWEPRCFFGMSACMADGINVECRFCGAGAFKSIRCPTVTTTTTTTTPRPTQAPTTQTTTSTLPADCSGLPNVAMTCSDDGCKVLARGMMGRSCGDYCGSSGLICENAWDDMEHDCNVKVTLDCDTALQSTSDLICHCAVPQVTTPGPGNATGNATGNGTGGGAPVQEAPATSVTATTTTRVIMLSHKGLLRVRHGLCLEAEDADGEPGAWVTMQLCDEGHPGQHFEADASTGQVLTADHRFCLDAPQQNKNGGRIDLWTCDAANLNQQWLYNQTAGLLQNLQGLCVDAYDRDVINSSVRMWGCNDQSWNQQWLFGGASPEPTQIRSAKGICLDAPEPALAGGKVQMWLCDGGRQGQQWLYDRETGLVRINGGVCLEAPRPRRRGGEVLMQPCLKDVKGQQWEYDKSTGRLKGRFGICLDARNGNALGTGVHMWRCERGNWNQRWEFGARQAIPGAMLRSVSKEGMCVESANYATNGGKLRLAPCDASLESQHWVHDEATGLARVRSGICLDAPRRRRPRSKLHMWDCNFANKNQQFDYNASKKQFRSRKGICVAATEDGIQMARCDQSNAAQHWLFGSLQNASSNATTHSRKPKLQQQQQQHRAHESQQPTAQRPVLDDEGRWVLAAAGESCEKSCGSRGLQCERNASWRKNSDVDNTTRLGALLGGLGAECSAFFSEYGANPDVPCFAVDSSHCYTSAPHRPAETFHCRHVPGPTRRRLCWCAGSRAVLAQEEVRSLRPLQAE